MTTPYHSSEDPPYDSRDRGDSSSIHSNSPLKEPTHQPPATYPPPLPSSQSRSSSRGRGKHVRIPTDSPFEPESGMMYSSGHGSMPLPAGAAQPGMPEPSGAGTPGSRSRNNSWDLLSGIRKFEHSYEEFDSRNASQTHLAFADGDVPKNRVSRLYNYLINVSIVTRWFLFIVPVLGLLWIPGILGVTTFPRTEIWAVKLIWWSIWLSVVWVGWWAALAFSMVLPHIAKATLGVVALATRRYIDWLAALHRYVALLGWMLAVWISYQPLINTRQRADASDASKKSVDTLAKLLFGFWVCTCVLVFEKFSIQWIAGKFHERSYAERIAAQKFAVRTLVTLYRHSSDIPGRTDTLKDGPVDKRQTMNPKKLFKRALKGVRNAATTTTTALGNVASEIAGSSVLQPNSPQAMVQTALSSANKSRLLARRLFYSFARPGAEYIIVEDIARFFPTPDDADAAFAIFDKDSNGDANRDEIEMACMEFHREQLSIENSMRDLDSAVGRLDNIFMSLYVIVSILIIAVALETQLVTLITGAGTIILGLSWLVGGSLTEVLTSIIFLFIKHPYDVGDRVTVGDKTFTVKEIRLLSTIFLDANSCLVQAPNTVLNTNFIYNMRRSPQMSESFSFDVAYGTTFEQIENLRGLMIEFLKVERRDYQAVFDVMVIDIPGQEKMTLRVDIKYKSNWQQGALKAKRRNKWICALKSSLTKVKIFGPGGDPDAKASPSQYTLVPYEDVKREEELTARSMPMPTVGHMQEHVIPTAYTFSDPNAVMLDDTVDVFGEADELHMTNPRRGPSDPSGAARPMGGVRQRPTVLNMPSGTSTSGSTRDGGNEIEMRTPRAGAFEQV